MRWGCKNTKDFGKFIVWDSKFQYFLENDFFYLNPFILLIYEFFISITYN